MTSRLQHNTSEYSDSGNNVHVLGNTDYPDLTLKDNKLSKLTVTHQLRKCLLA